MALNFIPIIRYTIFRESLSFCSFSAPSFSLLLKCPAISWEYANFEEANAIKKPLRTLPLCGYFTPFLLRAAGRWPDKFWGFVFFAASVAIPFCPYLGWIVVKSNLGRYRGMVNRAMLLLFVASFFDFGCIRGEESNARAGRSSRKSALFFTSSFFLGMPIWSTMDKNKPVPERVDHGWWIALVAKAWERWPSLPC